MARGDANRRVRQRNAAAPRRCVGRCRAPPAAPARHTRSLRRLL